MTITIKLFGAGETQPRFVGTLERQAGKPIAEDVKLLWDIERSINENAHARCYIETSQSA